MAAHPCFVPLVQPWYKALVQRPPRLYHRAMEKNVAKLPYLHQPKDRSGWIFRAAIPHRLRAFAKMSEFKRSLGPTYQEAMQRYHGVALEWAALRDELERMAADAGLPVADDDSPPVTYKTLTARERKRLDYFISSWGYRSNEAHKQDARDLSDDELADYEDGLMKSEQALRACLRRMTPPDWFVVEIEEQLAATLGMRLHPDCPDRQEFLMRVVDVELQALRVNLDRLAGTAVHPDPPKPGWAAEDALPVTVKTLFDAFNHWADLKTRAGGEKTVNEYRAFAERFARFALDTTIEHASFTALASLTRERQIGRRWLEHVAASQGVQRKTLKKYRSALSTLFAVAIDNGMTDVNPFAFRLDSLQLRGTQAEEVKGNKEARSPLPSALIDRYFAGPLFHGPGFDRRLPASVAYWFPLLLRFTGARPLELSYLMRDDIVLADDAVSATLAGHGGASWIYIFSDMLGVGSVERPIKKGVSLRRFPIPQILLDHGFADYVRSVPRGAWLLPMPVSANAPENRARYALNALGDYLRTTLGEQNEQYVTYSFRHTVVDEAREAGVPQEVRDNLVGHSEGDLRSKNAGELFYGARWFPAAPLLDAVAKLGAQHRLPPGFPSWAEFQRRTPDFSGVTRTDKALPLKQPRKPRLSR